MQPKSQPTVSDRAILGSKAETLYNLQPLVSQSTILDLYYFSVREWRDNPHAVIDAIMERFAGCRLAIRSSALDEDGANHSMAGAYESCLGVNGSDRAETRAAIQTVVDSYSGAEFDQVLVQPMLEDVEISGVIMTHDLESGAPYQVVNYDDESGATNHVTSGIGSHKALFVYREVPPEHLLDSPVSDVLGMSRELELLFNGTQPLDIEFARTTDGQLYLLQARRLAAQSQWDPEVQVRIAGVISHLEDFVIDRSRQRVGVAGNRTILGQMPDWNPAEIIGTNPRPLSVSLYRYLVTDQVWRDARAMMGYKRLPTETLMVMLAGAPYIDVRNSFNSFLPAGLDVEVEERLINAWLDRLAALPELHDKVEFEVAHTVLDFAFDESFADRYREVLSADELAAYKERLRELTRNNVGLREGGTLCTALARVRELEVIQDNNRANPDTLTPPLRRVALLLDECQRLGTFPFSVIARHAFIAETLLRSAARRGAISYKRLEEFKRSLVTVAGQLTVDIERVMTGELPENEFFRRYGHLRPGTYDIVSQRYDQREDLFTNAQVVKGQDKPERFVLTEAESAALGALLQESGIDTINPKEFLHYAEVAIVSREDSKFTFSRHLSDAIEVLADWGSAMGLDRDDVSYLDLREILDTLHNPFLGDWEAHLKSRAAERRRLGEMNRHIRLGSLIREPRDIYVVPVHTSVPNFVTSQRVESPATWLDGRMTGKIDLTDRIVCIENADPGFDWIFTRRIAGLISKYGGANSHMTIRCAELGVPAAIGVGEQMFDRLARASRIELNCADKIVRAIDV